MYIVLNRNLAHYDLQRAWRFKRTFENFIDAFVFVNKQDKWTDYSIFYIE